MKGVWLLKIIKLKWGNCLFWALYIAYRVKLKRLLFVRGSKPRAIHIICETVNGHLIQFKTTKKYDRLAPFFFQGAIRSTRKKYAKRVYQKRLLFSLNLN
jgi:hypothetical protein